MDYRLFCEPQQGASYETLRALATKAAEVGFEAFFRSDHYMAFSGDGLPGPTDAWTSLAGLARDTEGIRLGTLMSPVTFRWPGPLAIAVANVDEMSGGRVELGIGTGWHDGEHKAYGIPFGDSFGERFEMLTEQLEIIDGMWSTPTGETFDYTGKHYAIEGSPALPKPTQRPRPPILIGGAGPTKTPALVARFADEYNLPFTDLDTSKAAFDRARQACEAIDRDPATLKLSVALTTVCGADDNELARRAKAIGFTPEGLAGHGGALFGTPAQVVERIGAYRQLGIHRIYLQVLDPQDLEHLDLLGAEVLEEV